MMRRLLWTLALAVAASNAVIGASSAQAEPDRVEEDWEVVLTKPDPATSGPQFTTYMSPVQDDSEPFALFGLNYRDYPSFAAGGMQIRLMNGEQVLGSSSKESAKCASNDETITWTQRLNVSGGNLTYLVVDGQSTTWGSFGHGQSFTEVSTVSSITSLAGYSPATSVAESGAGWQSNRIAKMTLLRVRYYQGGSLMSTDETPRSVKLSN